MSSGVEALKLREEDVFRFLACQTHVGATNVDFQMDQYVFKRKPDGVYIIDLRKTWEKINLAARILAAIESESIGDVCVISARPYAQRAVLKFAAHTGATPIVGRFTPGTFTNQIQKQFKEPRVLVISDPRVDQQAVKEASYANIPVIAFCNTDSPLKLIDVAVPCNNKGAKSLGLMWWLLARQVLLMRGKIGFDSLTNKIPFRIEEKEIMPDLYFYRDPEEAEKEEQEAGSVADKADQWKTPVDFGRQPETGIFQPSADQGIQPSVGGGLGADAGGGTAYALQTPDIRDWAQETQNWTATHGVQEWGGTDASSWNKTG